MAIKPEIDSVSPFPPIAGGGTTTKPISGNSYAIGLKNGGKIYVEIDSVTDTVKVHGNLDVDGILKGIETLTNAGNIKVQTLTSGIKVTGNIETDTLNVLGDIEGQNVKLATIENLAGNQFLDLKTNSFSLKIQTQVKT